MRLNEEIAIVTGGGQGIGREIALRLAQEGAIVFIADVDANGARETERIIFDMCGRKASVVLTDVSQEKQTEHLVRETLKTNNRIDILVNNAGIMGPVKNIEDIAVEEWDQTMAVNLRGMFLCCKYVVPVMKRQEKGSIVNIASITGKRPLTQRLPYAVSKMGVIGLTRTLAAEVGKFNIRVNAVCPGAVEGPRLKRVFEGIMKYSGKSWDQVVAERLESTPLKTLIDPKQIAAVVAFLCSEDAAMMTGEDVNVSAGAVMF
jgi:NAD(P)-dependent dehydrogenase (short-subunit alcohol dehydrogenase family)